MIKPTTQTPSLTVPTLNGNDWTLSEQQPQHFTVVVFYRGYHCPICKTYIRDLDRKVASFAEKGINAVAISSDTQERAEKTRAEWGLETVTVGYDLPLDKAREWGLYTSKAIKDNEPAEFSEPGLFVVRPDGTLYASAIQTMPFTRPSFNELLGALDYIINHDYPARGDL